MAPKDEKQVFLYKTGIRVTLLIIDVLLTLILVAGFADRNAWLGGIPLVALILIPVVPYFAWVAYWDGGQKVTVTKEKIIWENGKGRHYRKISIPWHHIAQMRDDTKIFTIGRRFQLVSLSDPGQIIKIDSALREYRVLLRIIVGRIPAGLINDRARKSLRHMRIM